MQNKATAPFSEIAWAVLKEGSRLSFRAGGKSMSPFICDNETVIIEPPARPLRIGDVVLFAGEGPQLILHRIVKIRVDGYVTKGDATCHFDRTVPRDAVLGRAVHIVGGLNFHLRFPLSTLVAFALRLRDRPMIFNILRIPGRLLLRRLRSKLTERAVLAMPDHTRPPQIDLEHDPCNNNYHENS
jgi:hypothetical protein